MKFASLFTGGGGCDIGARIAGLSPVWGIEYDQKIANTAQDNGIHVICADVRFVDYSALPQIDVLHASPPCVSYSVVNRQKSGETTIDIELASAVARAIRVLRPTIFTLENVAAYSKSAALQIIRDALTEYALIERVVNFHDYGVPQVRKRFILVAHRRKTPEFAPTGAGGSWDAAIADLDIDWGSLRVPTPKRVEGMRLETDAILSIPRKFSITTRYKGFPMFTIVRRAEILFIYRNHVWYRTTPEMWRRWQTFPDWYRTPNKTRAVTIYGNAVPPVGYANIIRQIVEL